MKSRYTLIITGLTVSIIISACAGVPSPDETSAQAAVAPTQTSLPSATPEPEPTLEPTATDIPPTLTPIPPTPTPEMTFFTTKEEITGIWHGRAFNIVDLYFQFNEDGTYILGAWDESEIEEPFVWGEYWFEDEVLHLRETGNQPQSVGQDRCDIEIVGRYQAHVIDDDGIELIVVKDPCYINDDNVYTQPRAQILWYFRIFPAPSNWEPVIIPEEEQ